MFTWEDVQCEHVLLVYEGHELEKNDGLFYTKSRNYEYRENYCITLCKGNIRWF